MAIQSFLLVQRWNKTFLRPLEKFADDEALEAVIRKSIDVHASSDISDCMGLWWITPSGSEVYCVSLFMDED